MPDRDALLPMLRSSMATFIESFGSLGEPQLRFKEGPDRWSIAETAEHVILSEIGSGKLMRGRMIREPTPPELLAATADGDERVDRRLRARDQRFAAPDFVRPVGTWPTAQAMVEAFEESRLATIEFLATTPLDLTSYAAPHPALGPLTGLQWAHFLVLHCLRHVEQIEETKRAPGYPA
ncbi:MAG: DinB family protein [Gemmatimonadales bacterium]